MDWEAETGHRNLVVAGYLADWSLRWFGWRGLVNQYWWWRNGWPLVEIWMERLPLVGFGRAGLPLVGFDLVMDEHGHCRFIGIYNHIMFKTLKNEHSMYD